MESISILQLTSSDVVSVMEHKQTSDSQYPSLLAYSSMVSGKVKNGAQNEQLDEDKGTNDVTAFLAQKEKDLIL